MKQEFEISDQQIELDYLSDKGIKLHLRRLDQLANPVTGNKFFKLKYNLLEAKKRGCKKILTFGGAYSNHIYAVAMAAKTAGFDSIGLIRGEETLPLNPTLAFAKNQGMQIVYLDRSTYRQRHDRDFLDRLAASYPEAFMLPEGGTNEFAIRGTAEIVGPKDNFYSHFAVPIGTGGTFLGLLSQLQQNQHLLGFSALKGAFIHQDIEEKIAKYAIKSQGDFRLFDGYHFGGYAKINDELLRFIKNFKAQHNVLLDPIYTSKMMYGLLDLIAKDYFPTGSNILAIHTGGLQGWAGFKERFDPYR